MSALYDDPNREAVGLDPIWTDAENPPIPDPEADDDEETKTTRKAKSSK